VLPAGATKPALQLSQPADKILSNSIPTSVSVTATENSALYGATGVTLAYQWQLNGVNIDAGNAGDRTGYDAATLNFTAPTAADAGTYTCIVTDTVGDGTYPGTYSLKASLVATEVDPTPVITAEPATKTIAHVGDNVTWTVTAAPLFSVGNPLSYQWEYNGVAIPDATGSSFTTNNVQVSNAGYYDVIVANAFLVAGVTSSVVVLDVVQPGVVVGTGTGLQGYYYTLHTNGVNDFANTANPTLSRLDPTIDFNWLAGSPAASISVDYFTVRWFGQVQALDTDTYTFYTVNDDGLRLWVNGQLLIDHWIPDNGSVEHSGTIALTANQIYPIMLEYFEHTGNAQVHLRWSGASGGVVKEIVPMSQLIPCQSLPAPQLTWSVSGSDLVFNWPGTYYALYWATNVIPLADYTNVVYNGTGLSPYTFINAFGPEPQKFFILKSQ
jgi:hypothetical protein